MINTIFILKQFQKFHKHCAVVFGKRLANGIFSFWVAVFAFLAVPSFSAENTPTSEQISSYMAGRIKELSKDYSGAAEHYKELIANDPENPFLLNEGLIVFIADGDWSSAVSAADKLDKAGAQSFFAANTLIATELMQENYFDVISRVDQFETSIGHDLPPIVRGWANIGAQEIDAADNYFNSETKGNADLHRLHWALALALNGNFEAAEEEFVELANSKDRPGSVFDQLITAWVQTLVQLERDEEALQLIAEVVPRINRRTAQTLLLNLSDRISNEEQVDYEIVSKPAHGLSKYYSALARDLVDDNDGDLKAAILFARLAQMLNPENTEIIYELASYFIIDGNNEVAIELLDQISITDPLYIDAQFSKSESLRTLEGQSNEAIEILINLIEENPDNIELKMTLGSYRIEDKDYLLAKELFEEAVQLLVANAPETEDENIRRDYFTSRWRPIYMKAVANERLGNWEEAKSGLILAADYSDGLHQVLNYLGYSMLIYGDDVLEAEKLIRRALEADPENAAYIDSLGWAQFLQGKYQEALPNLEKAVRLMPNTAEVIDHLGDVYWKVGREREAVFQWKRALLFEDENIDKDKVQRKIEIGLDRVLEEETASPDS